MKLIFVLASLTAAALAAPANDGGVKLTHFGHDVGPDGYAFAFATSDGTYRHEIGGLKSVGDSDSLSVQGAYSFVGGDGNQYAVSYTADENGFQVQNPFKPSRV